MDIVGTTTGVTFNFILFDVTIFEVTQLKPEVINTQTESLGFQLLELYVGLLEPIETLFFTH